MSMAYNRLRLRVPDQCTFCMTPGRVRPEQTITGSTVVLKWSCEACERDWPVHDDELSERRQGPPDRRRKSRSDRRDATMALDGAGETETSERALPGDTVVND
jgi:hypothetical protein